MHVAMEMTFDPGTYTSVSHHTLIFVPSLAATIILCWPIGLMQVPGVKGYPRATCISPSFYHRWEGNIV